ncbi:gastric triacylglycerol lipase-like [Actinia tenebrosa]|uniref:Lipase n=1 Tax=Actinia tenebrosa TaxID=6105 RepID=A0A6P8IGX8_ACTTE|nr:gastric triacylglycerol lipase-like [Actinia tenebrosa]
MLLLVLLASLWSCNGFTLYGELPEVHMNVTQMIEYNGYPSENYDVLTQDGYIINIQRIPYGRHGKWKDKPSKPIVFLQHGLLCSSTNWVSNLPNESLGFILADNGYDVWLGNARGNTYGLKHVNLSIRSAAFWNFTWDEMAQYDLPAMLNFVLKKTGQPTLYYAGHSQGTMIAFAEFSHNKDLAKKVKTMFALGPVATVGYIESPIKLLAIFLPEIEDFFKFFGIYDFLPNNEIMKILADLFCGPKDTREFCSDVIFLLDGFDEKQLNKTRLPVYIAHTPAGTSVKNMYHYAQSYRSKKFQKFDYGTVGNRIKYGQDTPPLYNLSTFTVPTELYSGGEDWLADPKDVSLLCKAITKTVVYHEYIKAWQHLDFIWGLDAASLVYDKIVKHINATEHSNYLMYRKSHNNCKSPYR